MTCESVACRSYFTNKSFRAVCARSLICVCACVYESSEASAYSFGLATNPTRARSYPLNINPKPESILGPAGSGSRPLKTTRGHFRLVHLICVCSFSGYLLFILHCSRGKKIINTCKKKKILSATHYYVDNKM